LPPTRAVAPKAAANASLFDMYKFLGLLHSPAHVGALMEAILPATLQGKLEQVKLVAQVRLRLGGMGFPFGSDGPAAVSCVVLRWDWNPS
jgi:hypothetical protein